MQVDINTLLAVITTTLTSAGTLVGAVIWIGNKIQAASDKMADSITDVTKEIAKIREEFVSHDLCRERRDNCPCITQMRMISETVEEMESRVKRSMN